MEHKANLMDNSGRDIGKTKVWVWHVTTIDFPQANTKTVNITLSVVWFTIKNLLGIQRIEKN
jgi:type III secretory pathway component EscR